MEELESRLAVSIRAKEPVREWLAGLPSPITLSLEQINVEPSVYLVPDRDYDDDIELLKGGYWESIFEHELDNWWSEPHDWPQERTSDLFLDWFEVEVHGMIVDLAENWDGYDD